MWNHYMKCGWIQFKRKVLDSAMNGCTHVHFVTGMENRMHFANRHKKNEVITV